MRYKGYTGVVEFDEESGVLFGRVIGLRDYITFQGDSVAEVTLAFRESVDVYLELCAERGESPEKPFSGQFILRINSQLHRALSNAAEELGKSLNSLIESHLEEIFLPAGGVNADSVLYGAGGGGRTKGAVRLKSPAKPGKAPSVRGRRRSAAAKSKGPSEVGRELKAAKGSKALRRAKGPKR
jgi:predicted HicB family RNase H-like nuclease